MKIYKLFLLLFFSTAIVVAQDLKESDVPKEVTSAFAKEYPQANKIEWEKKMDLYKVEFNNEKMEHEVYYSPSGKVVKKERDIMESDLPLAVRDAIKSKYAGYRIDDVEQHWENKSTSYKVELKNGSEEWKLTYDSNGKVLQEKRD